MKYIDLDSCHILDDKIICDYKKPKFEQNTLIRGGRGGIVHSTKDGQQEFTVEAAPYLDQSVGISVPTSPLPGTPSINFDFGTSWPFTILPLPTRLVDRIGQSWLPIPLQSGPEDKFQALPDVDVMSPDELAREVVYPKKE